MCASFCFCAAHPKPQALGARGNADGFIVPRYPSGVLPLQRSADRRTGADLGPTSAQPSSTQGQGGGTEPQQEDEAVSRAVENNLRFMLHARVGADRSRLQ